MKNLEEQVSKLSDDKFAIFLEHVEKEKKFRVKNIMDSAEKRVANMMGKKTRRNPPKFRCKKTGQAWSGIGRPPRWYLDYVNSGGDPDNILV